MAKITKKYSFSKAELSFEDGKYTITEMNKDDSTDYNLSAVLNSFVDQSGISLSIGIDDEVPSVEES